MRVGYELDGVRVAQARLALDERGKPMTQTRFAELVGIHNGTMNRIENGKARVSLETLEKIVTLTGRSREWLVGDTSTDREAEQRQAIVQALAPLAEALLLVAREVAAASDTTAKAAA